MRITEFTPTSVEYENLPLRHYLLKSNLEAYLVYRCMNQWFGKPNSIDFDDNKTQWQYRIECKEAFLDVYDWKLESMSIAVYLKDQPRRRPIGNVDFDVPKDIEDKARAIADSFHNLVEKQSKHYLNNLRELSHAAIQRHIHNPYYFYRELAKQAKQDGQWNGVPSFFLSMAAVEGLINILYELYLHPHYREPRIQERLAREQIDLKIRLAPSYCLCFSARAIDSDNDSFREFLRFVNRRNDFVHANVTEPMITHLFAYEGNRFAAKHPVLDKAGLPYAAADFDIEFVDRLTKTIDSLCDLISQAMAPRYRREFRAILDNEYILVTKVDDEYIVEVGNETGP